MATLTPQEEAIMSRWDAGQSMQVIAHELGLSARKVRRTVSYLDGSSERRVAVQDMIAGSAMLAAAIRRERAL